jgi:hypothetical protein
MVLRFAPELARSGAAFSALVAEEEVFPFVSSTTRGCAEVEPEWPIITISE